MRNASDKRQSIDDILDASGGNFNTWWDETAAAGDDFEPIPSGTYKCLVAEGKTRLSNSGKPYFEISFLIVAGPFANRRVWKPIWLTKSALPLAKRDLAKLGIHRPEQVSQPIPAGMVAEVRVAHRVRDDGSHSNEVTGFKIVADAPEPGVLDVDESEGEGSTESDDESDGTIPF